MRTKQLLLVTALATVVAATGAAAQEAALGDQHQQHHPAGAQAAIPEQDAGAAPPAGGEPGTGMMGPGMMRMMEGGMPMAAGATMAQSPVPGVTIIINMQGMPMMRGPMTGAQAGGQGTPGMMGMGGQGMPAMSGMGSAAAQGPAAQAYEEAMDKMHRGMAVTPSGDADVDFARMMIPHHQGAIDMARVELAQGKDPTLRAMAQDIVKAQEGKIATLKDWLAKHAQ